MTALNLVVEEMVELLLGHTRAGILDRYLYIVASHLGLHVYPALLIGKLAGIVGQCVQHKQRQHLVGLHHGIGRLNIQLNTLHQERLLTLGQHIEQRLQLEALYVQTQFALSQLYPVGQHVIILVYLINQLADVRHSFLAVVVAQTVHLVYHAVDERCDVAHQRYLGALF